MSDEIRNDESSTDEVINDIVEETLEEQDAKTSVKAKGCLLYTSDAADEL